MTQASTPRLIIAFVADVFFQTKIEAAAERTDLQVEWVERADQIRATAQAVNDGSHTLWSDPQAALVERLSSLQPALLIFDLGNNFIPWREWIAWIKTSPATRRIPLVAYGAHVDGENLKSARSAGADLVTARSHFSSDLDGILLKYVRRSDTQAVQQACEQELSGIARRGLELFNQQQYFEAHELLEEAWNEDQTAGRELYRAILQVAVAYLQIERGNFNGAVKMFWRLRQWIDPLPDVCRGVDVRQLRTDAQAVYETLVAAGPGAIGAFDLRSFRPVIYAAAGGSSDPDS